MDSSKHIEKCLSILDNKNFVKIPDEPTERIECKIQRCNRKIKNKISKTEYLQLDPTDSSPGKFYGTTKIHKLPNVGNITELSLDLYYRMLAHHRIAYQSIWLNYCHHQVNQNILLKIQKNLSRISRDYICQSIIKNWYLLMYHDYSPTCR